MMPGDERNDRVIEVHGLARVEGEGSLKVAISNGEVTDVALTIFEPPRFFEAMLVGRDGTEAPDITSRICGICPVAYQLTACAAIEDAYGIQPSAEVAALRRLLYCGEWIQSHALHIHLLHAPDFFGCADAVELAKLDRSAIERGLRLKRMGNQLMELVGGRAVHPVNIRVGGFYRSPQESEISGLIDPLLRARDDALATLEWVAGFDFPDVERDYRFVALRTGHNYPIESGFVATSDGLELSPRAFAERVDEQHVERSTALQARLDGEAYLTGPLARFALNKDHLPAIALEAARRGGIADGCTNPFKSIIVRAIELVFACDEALRLARAYSPPSPSAATFEPRGGTGHGVTEAPRGLLLNRYVLDPDGTILLARIMPPTSQNQLSIETDLRQVVEAGLELSADALTSRCELAVRNHDPCISCAAHFLDVEIDRR